MKRLLLLLVVLVGGLAVAGPAERGKLTFRLQLVRGNDSATPPTPEAKPIGPRLSERLRAVFKWEHYWELKRESVTLAAGQKVCKSMSSERAVEVELRSAETMTIRIYRNGQLKRTEEQATATPFSIFGGEKDADQSWFIVVRREP